MPSHYWTYIVLWSLKVAVCSASVAQEASSINRSLMCLGQVIMALVDVSNGKNRHICYRDSKLTFLLRVCVDANSGGCSMEIIIPDMHHSQALSLQCLIFKVFSLYFRS